MCMYKSSRYPFVVIISPSQDNQDSSQVSVNVTNPEVTISEAPSNVSFCVPELYTGSVCRGALQAQQTCLLGDAVVAGDVFIPVSPNQEALEQTARTAIGGLPLLSPSPECIEVAQPFLCFSLFGLCDNHSRELYLPSSQQCRTVTEEICAKELAAAVAIIGSDQLPQCDEFPAVAENQECRPGIYKYYAWTCEACTVKFVSYFDPVQVT